MLLLRLVLLVRNAALIVPTRNIVRFADSAAEESMEQEGQESVGRKQSSSGMKTKEGGEGQCVQQESS